ncbi:MAG: hypothetical protein GC200_04605 [Tepidisphaera sp.]|nr:hypothetical protein [Tepidisphaera sp.]
MTQTLALLLDAYRELHSKKLFWITMLLSGLVVVSFGCVGITEHGVSVLVWEIPVEFFNSRVMSPATFYKLLFANLGISFWLAWIGIVLALISTAGMFPDFLANGSIDLMLSRPIGRWRLFFTKYFMGLLFVTLQVGVFSLASMLIIGIRGHSWEPSVLLAVPLVGLMFSYLFCVCTLLGILTRSTIAALLLTILFWVFLFGLHTTNQVFVQLREHTAARIEVMQQRIQKMERGTALMLDKRAAAEKPPADASGSAAEPKPAPVTYTAAQLDEANALLPVIRTKLVAEQKDLRTWKRWTLGLGVARAALPKTAETVELLHNSLIKPQDISRFKAPNEDEDPGLGRDDDDIHISGRQMRQRMDELSRAEPLSWIMGTSLGFEVVVVLIAGVIFSRRDF